MSYTILQDFYIYKYEVEDYPISLVRNIRYIWENNKDMWFSHEELFDFPMINTMYENNIGINMCLILQYDQLYRHPNKYLNENNKKYAYDFASSIALKMIHDKEFNNLKDFEKVFTLLAIRHNKNLKLKYFVLKKVYKLLEEEPTNSLYLRFLNATILDIDKYKNEVLGHNEYKTTKKLIYNHPKEVIELNKLLEEPRLKEVIMKNKSSKYIKELERELYHNYKSLVEKYSSDKYAVSISGGVDSMVLSYIMKKVCDNKNKELILLHICYSNRDCCSKELELLEWWAKKLNLKLYVREIDEIKRSRNTSFRALYEKTTRNIRFSFYKYFNCPILLGHNKDDCFENVFSNFSKKIHFDNLFGMSEYTKESDVVILRPMLTIEKEHIYNYADYNEIPHLYDSTPVWSNRGKTRDILMPAINNFNKDIIPGMYEYIKYVSFLEEHWKVTFNLWLTKLKEVNKNKDEIIIEYDDYFNLNYKNLNFWVNLWFGLELQTRPSNVSFNNLIIFINKYDKRKNNKKLCNLNKEFLVELNNNLIKIKKIIH